MFSAFRAGASALALAGTLAGAGMTSSAIAAEPSPEFAVTPAQMQALGVSLRRLDQPTELAGLPSPARVTLPPGQDVVVSAPLDGVIDRLLVNPQDPVKAGQPLLRMASPGYGELQLRLMEADSRARLARQTLERERQLFSEGIIPERRMQEAQAGLSSADAAVRQAEAALRLAGADAASVRRAAATDRLDDTLTVRARSDGLVVSLDARPGQRVKEADPLLRIANLKELWLEVEVPAGTPLPRGREFGVAGKNVTAVAQSMASTVGEGQTQTLRARVTRGAAELRPGEVVQVHVPFASGNAGNAGTSGNGVGSAWTLPLAALTYQGSRAYVFVRSARGFIATPVTVLKSAGSVVQVQAQPPLTLKAGQDVAVASVIALKSAWLGMGGGE